jgi:asparagine synthase (glutamine-hydrolysing)
MTSYYDAPAKPLYIECKDARVRLAGLLASAVTEPAIADVPVCTLLSGGIDSSIIAALLKPIYPDLVAYTAVYDPKSSDLRNARRIAEHLGIVLREVIVPAPAADDLARVIRIIEMPYKAQVEIGWPCLCLAESMRADGFKVTFSGEGSDELWASYGFAYHALKTQDWHEYRKALFLSQAHKKFARCKKVFMAESIECRLPFLNPALVEFALSLPQSVVQDGRSRPKAILQDAFASLLPDSVVRRSKIAFQDGLGIKQAILSFIPKPERYYHAEYNRCFA